MFTIKQIGIEIGRLVRFGMVGTAAGLVYAAVSFIVVEAGVANPIAATILGHLCAGVVSYLGHLYYSFAVAPQHQIFLVRFVVIAAIAFAMNIGVTWLFTSYLGISYRWSILAVTVLIPLTNYLCNRFWVFLPGLVQSPKAGGA